MKSTTILLIATIQLGYLLINLNSAQALPVVNKSKPQGGITDKIDYLQTKPSIKNYNSHVHRIYLTKTELLKLNKAFCDGKTSKYLKMKETKESFFHFHVVNLCRINKKGYNYKIVQCDGSGKCWDGHDSELNTFFKASST